MDNACSRSISINRLSESLVTPHTHAQETLEINCLIDVQARRYYSHVLARIYLTHAVDKVLTELLCSRGSKRIAAVVEHLTSKWRGPAEVDVALQLWAPATHAASTSMQHASLSMMLVRACPGHGSCVAVYFTLEHLTSTNQQSTQHCSASMYSGQIQSEVTSTTRLTNNRISLLLQK